MRGYKITAGNWNSGVMLLCLRAELFNRWPVGNFQPTGAYFMAHDIPGVECMIIVVETIGWKERREMYNAVYKVVENSV